MLRILFVVLAWVPCYSSSSFRVNIRALIICSYACMPLNIFSVCSAAHLCLVTIVIKCTQSLFHVFQNVLLSLLGAFLI